MSGEDDEKKKGNGWFDGIVSNLNPMNWIGGLGGVLKLGIFAVVLYFIARSEGAQHLIGKMFGADAEKWVHDAVEKVSLAIGGLTGKLTDEQKAKAFNDMSYDDAKKYLNAKDKDGNTPVPEGVYDVITKSPENWKAFQSTVKAAQDGGTITSLDQITNSRSIFKLMSEQSALTAQIIAGAGKSTDKAMTVKILTSVKTMLDDGSFDKLCDASHIDNTVNIMVQVIPADKLQKKGFKDAATLKLAIASQMKDGKMSDLMRKGFKDSLDEMIKEAGGTTTNTNGTTNSTGTPTTKIVGHGEIEPAAAALVGENNVPALLKLKTALGERFDIFVAATAKAAAYNAAIKAGTTPPEDDGSTPPISILAMKSENVAAVTRFANAVDITTVDPSLQGSIAMLRDASKNTEYQKALTHLADKDIDPQQLLFQCFGSVNINGQVETPSASLMMSRMMMKPVNESITKAGTNDIAAFMGANAPEYKDMFTKENLDIILNTTKILGNKPQNFVNSTPDVMGAFIELAVHNNSTVLSQVLTKNPHAVSQFFNDETNCIAFTSLVNGLEVNGPAGKLLAEIKADWGNKKQGLLEVLADDHASSYLPSLLKGAEYSAGGWDMFLEGVGIGSDDKLLQNADALRRLAATIKEVGAATTVTPANTTNANQQTTTPVVGQ